MQISNEQKKQLKDDMINNFVPNFKYLAVQVKNDIQKIIQVICNNPTKEYLQKLSRLSLLEEAPTLRSHLWKLILQTLPLDPQSWDETKTHNLLLYKTLIQKFLPGYLDEEDLIQLNDSSQVKLDQNLWGQIELDTKRTHSTLNFFQKQISHTKLYLSKKTKNHDIMSRILYIWGKINPTVRYVQGMNQILAPLYYPEFQNYNKFCESQVFFMFASIMGFVIDMHIKQMDESADGIMGKMRSLNDFLKVVDYNLWEKLTSQNILPQYYSFRWLSLMLAQQFGLCQTMTLWDSMLSYEGYKRYLYLFSCCIAILKLRKEQIMEGDFISILPMIQKIKHLDVSYVIKLANKIYDKYCKFNIEKLSQKMEQERKIQRQKNKNNQKQNKEKSWNYGQIVKNTATFLYKWMPSNSNNNKENSKY